MHENVVSWVSDQTSYTHTKKKKEEREREKDLYCIERAIVIYKS